MSSTFIMNACAFRKGIIYFNVLFTFYGFARCKVKVRLTLGVFSYANVPRKWPDVNPRVRVPLQENRAWNF